jgi:hypothetical protein
MLAALPDSDALAKYEPVIGLEVQARTLSAFAWLGSICFANFLGIGKVSQSARSNLRCNQIFLGNEKCCQMALGVNDAFDSPFPSSIKIHAIDSGEDIHRNGRLPEPDELARIGKVVNSNAAQRSAKTYQGSIGCFGVRRIGLDEEIKVLCGPRLRVKRNRIAADN